MSPFLESVPSYSDYFCTGRGRMTPLLRERFPDWREVATEAQRPVPPIPFRKGGSGLTRLETLLLQVKAGRR